MSAGPDATISSRLAEYRAMRQSIEAAILPLATSTDGRRFSFQLPLDDLEIRVGGYVSIESRGERWLGQVLALEVASVEAADVGWSDSEGDAEPAVRSRLVIHHASGHGVVLDGPPRAFHEAVVRLAPADDVGAWIKRTTPSRATLPVGDLRMAGVPFALDAGGFDRHTFLCGQSGSGKTYSLGVLLEHLLLETALRVVVLDPNSDFVNITRVRDGTDPEVAERYGAATETMAIHRAGSAGEERLRLRLPDLDPAARAAALRLDPIGDAAEYAELSALLEEETPEGLAELDHVDRPSAEGLARRARNLGADRWGIWARTDPGSSLDALTDPAIRGLVVDLGSLATREEQALAAGAVLERLWRERARREPVLIVIDEAHNVCPSGPTDALTTLATDYAVSIAGEGRKFGLYLLVSTQRPLKVHANVLSQCDNLILMRMNSTADLEHARDVFSFVPPALFDQAPDFRLGEALVAGKLASHPALLQIGARIAEEGGADVPATWATAGRTLRVK